MPLFAWMKRRPGAPATSPAEKTSPVRIILGDRKHQPDMWNGKVLPVRNITYTRFHYRLYDARTGTLLSFNSTNSLTNLVADVLRTRDENPTAQIYAVEYDGPAYPN